MNEVTIHLANGHCEDIHFDGEKEGTAINAFVLMTSVPVDPPATHCIVYGGEDTVARMLLSFWKISVRENPRGAAMLEEAARAIVQEADGLRGPWPGEGKWPVTPM